MRFSLRNRYYAWLLLLIVIVYSIIFASFCVVEYHESVVEQTPFTDQVPELILMLIIMLFTMPVSFIVAWTIAGRILRPLNQVLKTAEGISRGKFDERIPPIQDPVQLSRLAVTINEAFDRYGDAVQRLEGFSSNASHQLRTPLAVLRTLAEVNLQSDRTPEEYRDTIGQMLEESKKLGQTVEQLLMLSRLDPAMTASFKRIDLPDFLQELVDEARALFDDVQIEYDIPADRGTIAVSGNDVLLREVFYNLLNNSVVAAGPGGRIRISTRIAEDGSVACRFEDSGPGLSVEEQEKVFDRFYRGKHSHQGGSGLGLAIVKQIVQLHQGTITADRSADLGGAAMHMHFPRAH